MDAKKFGIQFVHIQFIQNYLAFVVNRMKKVTLVECNIGNDKMEENDNETQVENSIVMYENKKQK